MAARAARNGAAVCQVDDVGQLHKIVAESVADHMTHDYLVELHRMEWALRFGRGRSGPQHSEVRPQGEDTRSLFRRSRVGHASGLIAGRRQRRAACARNSTRRSGGPAAGR